MVSVVDKLFSDFSEMLAVLDERGELSLRVAFDDNFRKALLLAAASYFEHRLSEGVIAFISEVAGGDVLVPNLVRGRLVTRQYHSWFDWDAGNANKFFSMFGDVFKEYVREEFRTRADLVEAMRAFMEIGSDRNRLVHQNFAGFTLEKTTEEIFRLYQTATEFVDYIPIALSECSKKVRGN